MYLIFNRKSSESSSRAPFNLIQNPDQNPRPEQDPELSGARLRGVQRSPPRPVKPPISARGRGQAPRFRLERLVVLDGAQCTGCHSGLEFWYTERERLKKGMFFQLGDNGDDYRSSYRNKKQSSEKSKSATVDKKPAEKEANASVFVNYPGQQRTRIYLQVATNDSFPEPIPLTVKTSVAVNSERNV